MGALSRKTLINLLYLCLFSLGYVKASVRGDSWNLNTLTTPDLSVQKCIFSLYNKKKRINIYNVD